MKKIFFILLTLLTASTQADEVFKCQLKSGKTVYQSTPCESSVKQKTVEIQKVDPRKAAEEEAKLKAWKEDFSKREAERAKAEQELQAEKDRKASVEALRKSAEYERQQAYEAKRQADALERQNITGPYLQPYYPLYQQVPAVPYFQSSPTYPPMLPYHQHTVKERPAAVPLPPEETGINPSKNKDDETAPNKFKFK